MDWKYDFKNTLNDLDSPTLYESLNTYLWGVELVTVTICILLFLVTSHLLSREEYGQALMAFSASIVVGISPYLATLFFY